MALSWKRISEIIYFFESFIILWSCIGMLILVFVNVLLRYLLAMNITWASELATYLLVLVVYVAVSVSIRNKSEVRLTIFHQAFPKYANISFLMGILLGIFACLLFIFLGFETVRFLRKINMNTPGMNIPAAIPYSIVIFGGILSFIRYIESFHRLITTEKLITEGK